MSNNSFNSQKNTAKLGSADDASSDSFNSKREVHPEDYQAAAAESKDWIQKWSQHMSEDQKNPIVLTTARPVNNPVPVQVQPLIAESALKQLVQLYKKPPKEDSPVALETVKEDSLIQFQDRHRVFLKRPTQEKLDHFVALKQHEKKKVTDDLMDVGFE